MKDHPGYIYVIDLKPMGLPGYKIGMTKNLRQRMRQLQVPEKGTLCKWWYTQDVRGCEKSLHRMFDKARVPQSEWFKITEDQLRDIKATVNEWKEAHPSPRKGKKVITYNPQPQRQTAYPAINPPLPQLRELSTQTIATVMLLLGVISPFAVLGVYNFVGTTGPQPEYTRSR
tara:strand:- start:53 stop:568 length:516 start_codon:yes stop_codon:yes gene_type:complete